MKRRALLLGGAVLGAGAFAAPAIAQNRRTLKMATAWPADFPGFAASATRLAKTITELTGGSLTVAVQPAGDSLAPAQLHEACGSGRIDLYHAIEYYWDSKSKAFNFFAGIPFGLTAQEMDIWLHGLGGQELWDELAGRYNVKPFAAGNTGMRMAGWFRNKLTSKEEIENVRVRASGLAADIWRKLGAKIVAMPVEEMVPALKAKRLEGAEFASPWLDMTQGFQDVAIRYYYPGFAAPSTQVSLGVNLDLWNFLSEQERAAVRAACRQENARMLAEFNARNAESLQTLDRKYPDMLKQLPVEILNAAGKAAGDILSALAAADPLTGRVYQSYMDARARVLSEAKDGAEMWLAARREATAPASAETSSRQEPAETPARRKRPPQPQQQQQAVEGSNAQQQDDGDGQQGTARRRQAQRKRTQEADQAAGTN